MTIILPRPQFISVNNKENIMLWEKRVARKVAIPPKVMQWFIEERCEKKRREDEQWWLAEGQRYNIWNVGPWRHGCDQKIGVSERGQQDEDVGEDSPNSSEDTRDHNRRTRSKKKTEETWWVILSLDLKRWRSDQCFHFHSIQARMAGFFRARRVTDTSLVDVPYQLKFQSFWCLLAHYDRIPVFYPK